MVTSVLIRMLNGIKLEYGIRDILALLRFLTTSTSVRTQNCFHGNLRFKVAVISLPFRQDRRLHITEHLKSRGIVFSFFNAVHGKTQSSRAYEMVNFSSLSKKFLSPGSVGCIASHVAIWRELIATDYDGYLILEDDVILNINDHVLNSLFRKIPIDADIVYLGSGSNKGWPNMKKVSDVLAKPFSIRKGAYSYLLFRDGANKLLSQVSSINIVRGGIDSILGIAGMRNKLTVYHFIPSLCAVDKMSPSNILNVSHKSKIIHQIELL